MEGLVVGRVVGRRGWAGEGDEGLGAVAIDVEEESRVLVGGGKGGEVVCFLWPVRGVGLGTVVWGEKIGIAREGVFGGVEGGV